MSDMGWCCISIVSREGPCADCAILPKIGPLFSFAFRAFVIATLHSKTAVTPIVVAIPCIPGRNPPSVIMRGKIEQMNCFGPPRRIFGFREMSLETQLRILSEAMPGCNLPHPGASRNPFGMSRTTTPAGTPVRAQKTEEDCHGAQGALRNDEMWLLDRFSPDCRMCWITALVTSRDLAPPRVTFRLFARMTAVNK